MQGDQRDENEIRRDNSVMLEYTLKETRPSSCC